MKYSHPFAVRNMTFGLDFEHVNAILLPADTEG